MLPAMAACCQSGMRYPSSETFTETASASVDSWAIEVHDPVRLPCRAIVIGEGLLPNRDLWNARVPSEANLDRPVIQAIFGKEQAYAGFESTNHGYVD